MQVVTTDAADKEKRGVHSIFSVQTEPKFQKTELPNLHFIKSKIELK